MLDATNAAALARIVRRLDGLPLAVELAAARLRVFDAARLADLLNDQAGIAESLEAVALVAEREGDALDAVRLLGEAAGIRARTGAISPADEDRSRHELIEDLRVAVEPDAFAQAWAQGYRAGRLPHQCGGADQQARTVPAGLVGLEPDRNRSLP